jgi:hypothetical protein
MMTQLRRLPRLLSGARVSQPQIRLRVLTLLLAAFAGLSVGGGALAHVQIDVGDGRYVMELGFRDEPVYAGQPNALAVSVQEYATGGTKPVDGLAATLSAEVSKDGQVLSLPLVPKGDGKYEGLFIPTATGDYTFHVSGKIGDATVDESVTSGPNTFNSVEPLSTIEFPVHAPDSAEIAAQVAAASAATENARRLAIAGLVAGLLGLVLGAIAIVRSRRARVEPVGAPLEATGKLIR